MLAKNKLNTDVFYFIKIMWVMKEMCCIGVYLWVTEGGGWIKMDSIGKNVKTSPNELFSIHFTILYHFLFVFQLNTLQFVIVPWKFLGDVSTFARQSQWTHYCDVAKSYPLVKRPYLNKPFILPFKFKMQHSFLFLLAFKLFW